MKKKILACLAILLVLALAFFHNDTPTTAKIATEPIEIIETTIEDGEETQEIFEEEIIENTGFLEEIEIIPNDILESEEEKNLPEESENEVYNTDELTCILLIECTVLLDNLDSLDTEKLELIPENGVIYPATEVVFYEGESVFDVLQRELKAQQIHLEFVNTPLYNSAYIEGIHNLYEFDAGALSGWMYQVNGNFPSYGCSQYILEDGDVISWQYTCDMGADLGVEYIG